MTPEKERQEPQTGYPSYPESLDEEVGDENEHAGDDQQR